MQSLLELVWVLLSVHTASLETQPPKPGFFSCAAEIHDEGILTVIILY